MSMLRVSGVLQAGALGPLESPGRQSIRSARSVRFTTDDSDDDDSDIGKVLRPTAVLGSQKRESSTSNTGSFAMLGPRRSSSKRWSQVAGVSVLVTSPYVYGDGGLEGEERDDDAMKRVFTSRDHESRSIFAGRVTRFCSFMTLVVAVMKVVAYVVSQSHLVRASLLDSIGDLLANLITLYTSYRIQHWDWTRYPAGQSRFEPLGVLCFAVLMVSVMSMNAVKNVEELVGERTVANNQAIERFWNDASVGPAIYDFLRRAAPASVVLAGDVSEIVGELCGQISYGEQRDKCLREHNDDTFLFDSLGMPSEQEVRVNSKLLYNLISAAGRVSFTDFTKRTERTITGIDTVDIEDSGSPGGATESAFYATRQGVLSGQEKAYLKTDVTRSGLFWKHSELDTIFDREQGLLFAMQLLGATTAYKAFLWLYLSFVAVPRTNSHLLRTLASDSRHDFVATSAVVACLLLGLKFRDDIGVYYEHRFDAVASLVLSSGFLYTWATLASEQLSNLSGKTMMPEFLTPLVETAQDVVNRHAVEIVAVRAYSYGMKHLCEIDLWVPDPNTPFAIVEMAMNALKAKIDNVPEIERTIVTATTGSAGSSRESYNPRESCENEMEMRRLDDGGQY